MASGPAEVIQAPPLAPPGQGLLIAAQVIDDPDADHWVEGVTFSPEVCSGVGVYALCVAGAAPAGGTHDAIRSFEPWVVQQRDECSTFGFPTADYQGRARRALLAHESRQVELEFWTGALLPGNAHLAQPHSTQFPLSEPVGTTAQASRKALAILEQAIADSAVGQGMIHATSTLGSLWLGNNLLRWDGRRWLTAGGNILVIGTGYPGTAPTGAGGGIAAAEHYAYATGLVQVVRGDITVFPDSISEATDRATNTVAFRAERPFVVLWNGCAHAAVKVTLA